MDRCGIACVWILFVLQCNTQKCLIRVFWALLVSLAKEAGNIEGSTEAAEFSASRVQRCLTVYLPNFAPALGVPGVEKAQRNRFDGRPTLSASQGNAIHPSAPPLSLHNWDKERFFVYFVALLCLFRSPSPPFTKLELCEPKMLLPILSSFRTAEKVELIWVWFSPLHPLPIYPWI